jgi:hypothetical protein
MVKHLVHGYTESCRAQLIHEVSSLRPLFLDVCWGSLSRVDPLTQCILRPWKLLGTAMVWMTVFSQNSCWNQVPNATRLRDVAFNID